MGILVFVDGASVDFSASHVERRSKESSESLRVRLEGSDNIHQLSPSSDHPVPRNGDLVELSDASKVKFLTDVPKEKTQDQLNQDMLLMIPGLLLDRLLVEIMSGRKLEFTFISFTVEVQTLYISVTRESSIELKNTGFGLAYDYNETTVDMETSQFHASGTIQLEDGSSFDFNISMMMYRETRTQYSERLRIGESIDPLMLSLNGSAVSLSNQKFRFDLNADGRHELIAMPDQASRFLAMDKNQDGQINDGNELFGPTSGNGFEELSQYDSNNDGWIDGTDPIYQNLLLWHPNAQPLSLQSQGIGAIYLRSEATPFSIINPANEGLAEVRSSSIFLNDNKTAGIIQQLDLTG